MRPAEERDAATEADDRLRLIVAKPGRAARIALAAGVLLVVLTVVAVLAARY